MKFLVLDEMSMLEKDTFERLADDLKNHYYYSAEDRRKKWGGRIVCLIGDIN